MACLGGVVGPVRDVPRDILDVDPRSVVGSAVDVHAGPRVMPVHAGVVVLPRDLLRGVAHARDADVLRLVRRVVLDCRYGHVDAGLSAAPAPCAVAAYGLAPRLVPAVDVVGVALAGERAVSGAAVSAVRVRAETRPVDVTAPLGGDIARGGMADLSRDTVQTGGVKVRVAIDGDPDVVVIFLGDVCVDVSAHTVVRVVRGPTGIGICHADSLFEQGGGLKAPSVTSSCRTCRCS